MRVLETPSRYRPPSAAVATGSTHQLYGWLLGATRRSDPLRRAMGHAGRTDFPDPVHDSDRDRGAVSLEQVLWFVAAGVAVAVVATLLWNRIFDQVENSPIDQPVAPGG